LGTDLVKSPERLVAAYNDAKGVTAAFNLNALEVMNRQLGADFDAGQFRHDAVWNAADSRIEMRLVAAAPQQVTFAGLGGHTIELPSDGWIRTEISVKFTAEQISRELTEVGLDVVGQWTDPDGDFLLTLARR
jgi:L-histidine N-alpha-methyltransferase